MTTKDIVDRTTILRATVGSTVHGLHHGGQDDRDEMAVFVEPPEYLLGLSRAHGIRGGLYGFEQFVERTQPEGARSGPGDLDLVAYSLRKWVRLALKGHPTILLLLFVPDDAVLVRTELGEELRALRPALLSQRAGRGYLGYLRGQKERLLGSRGQKRVNRPELVDAHGFDTKYAMHAARLGYQGLELLETGWLTLPMPEPERSRVMAIRTGERTLDETVAEIDEVERKLADALQRTPLPPIRTARRSIGSWSTPTAAAGAREQGLAPTHDSSSCPP
jgi:predicted nucleotidyltransferase